MEVFRGQAVKVEVLVPGDASAVYGITLRTEKGCQRSFKVAVTGSDMRVTEGDIVEVKVHQMVTGEDVVFCRNETTGRILVDRVNSEASRITLWVIGIALTLFVVAWFIVSNL